MNKHIFKYELPITNYSIELELPKNYAICDIQSIDDKIYLWALIDIHQEKEKIYFKMFGTGHKILNFELLYFIKTVVMANKLVWHIFIEKH